jgi:hypothetical protein
LFECVFNVFFGFGGNLPFSFLGPYKDETGPSSVRRERAACEHDACHSLPMSNHPVPANGGSAASAAPRGGKGWRLSAPHETVAPPPSPPQPSAPAVSLATSGEPDLSQVCSNPSDRVVLRNIIYTLYAIHAPGSGTLSSAESSCNSTSSSVASCYIVSPSLQCTFIGC